MDDQIIVRIKKEMKKEFAALAKQNGSDSSTLIRNYIDKYIEENRFTSKEDIDSMWDLGQALQKKMGIQQAFEYFKELRSVSDEVLVTNIMNRLAEYKVRPTKQLLELGTCTPLKTAFFAGFISETKDELE